MNLHSAATPPPADPRATITPESFAIDTKLLGLPLATPWRRLAAILVDLVVIALLVHAGGVLFAIAAAWIFWRVSGRTATGGFLRRIWRFAFRSMAAMVLFVVAVSSWGFWRTDEQHPRSRPDVYSAALVSQPPIVAERESGPENDGISRLEQTIRELESTNRSLQASLAEAKRERGLLPLMRTVADELGLGFGWSGLYFTAFLVLWRGQTPGKRLFRIRVVRLDGKPMTWWASFERFGGYAACIFTGLLGFAQMIWDRNRQGMHDKITETVVIQD